MNLEALSNHGRQESTCKEVADNLGIIHRYCDPDSSVRRELGVKDESEIGIFLSYEEERKRIRAEYEKRERWSLHELKNLGVFPALFICGADHAIPFAEVLSRNG